jgi:PAS domain S-box-containing protein
LIGVLYWPRATREGFILGLLAGSTIWAVFALLPVLTGIKTLSWLGINASGLNIYSHVTFWSLSFNTLTFAAVSLFTRPDKRQREAASACRNVGTRVTQGALQADSVEQFVSRLIPVTGDAAARAEVEKALHDLKMDWSERQPERLRILCEQIERNLSGMMGPIRAHMIVDQRLQLDTDNHTALAQNIRLMEERLESSQQRFRGVAAELDELRRYHRQILEDLPLGVAAVTANGQIMRWNPAMAALSGIPSNRVMESSVNELPPLWGNFLRDFLAEKPNHIYKRPLNAPHETRWLSLHKTAIVGPDREASGDWLLLVEDVTELQLLEQELAHSERLASIGRLAAGVAHEIGNPVTGITCIAQDLRLDSKDPQVQQAVEQILEQTHRISNIVHTLVSYAHAGMLKNRSPQPIHLADAVEEAQRVVQLSKRAQRLKFNNRIPPGLWVLGDNQRLVQVFVNLFSNSADACCGTHGQILITTKRYKQYVYVKVVDNGHGIPDSIQDKVMEPFFTTKPAGQGTGLGLPLVYNIIQEHGGDIQLDASPTGTCVTLKLPLTKVHP